MNDEDWNVGCEMEEQERWQISCKLLWFPTRFLCYATSDYRRSPLDRMRASVSDSLQHSLLTSNRAFIFIYNQLFVLIVAFSSFACSFFNFTGHSRRVLDSPRSGLMFKKWLLTFSRLDRRREISFREVFRSPMINKKQSSGADRDTRMNLTPRKRKN